MASSKIDGKWFREIDDGWKGYSVSLEIEEVLYHEKSDFQDILVFKSTTFGNVLVLDGVYQCTERDEFSYQEMIAHLPLNSHPNPTKVLVVGGGDGGVVREVLKYASVEQVVLCEIDQKVIDVSKKYLPGMASCLSDPRVLVHVGDGVKYMEENTQSFDVIITDAPDPIGAAEGLYTKDYYEGLKRALKPKGIISCQGETLWFDLNLIKKILTYCKGVFPVVAYASGYTPTYAGGHMGFFLCSNDSSINLKEPVRNYNSKELDDMSMKYYSPDVHRACFNVLPYFARKALKEVLDT
ncbi:spermidine synthase [Patella vulgata]|uniref:spermidine synthase n=1 Tax=Patella vulgata TaxID=6465 RepID=UPI0021802CBD|nr:spermidine synthase [Patella vulgata]